MMLVQQILEIHIAVERLYNLNLEILDIVITGFGIRLPEVPSMVETGRSWMMSTHGQM